MKKVILIFTVIFILLIGTLVMAATNVFDLKDIIFPNSSKEEERLLNKYTVTKEEERLLNKYTVTKEGEAVKCNEMYIRLESYIYSEKLGIGYCIFDVQVDNIEKIDVVNEQLLIRSTLYTNVISDGEKSYALMFLGSGSMNSEYEITNTGYKMYCSFNVSEYRKGSENVLYVMGENDSSEIDNITYTASFTLLDLGINDSKYKTDKFSININLLGASISGVINDFIIVYKNGDQDIIMSHGSVQGGNYYSSHNTSKTIVFENPCDDKAIDYILIDGIKYN